MNEIGVVMLGAAARGTVFAAIGLGLCLLLRKRGRPASGLVALATLVGMVMVSALGASSWPRWWSFNPPRPIAGADVSPIAVPQATVSLASDSLVPAVVATVEPMATGLGSAIRDVGRALIRSPAPADRPGWGWQAWVAVAGIAGVGIGLIRFALGLLAVAMLRRGSRPLDDDSMLDLAALIRAELGVGRAVALRVTPGLATPATVGWLRPAILLPEDWSDWDDRERRVVLSHEIAHIHNNDYFSGLLAQLSLALHYYHPLAHTLVGRLRLEQELAADAWGARLSGGNRSYLTTLARLALRNDPRPVGWPARSFRPGRGTFLRRIEMLRDMNESRAIEPLRRRTRLATLGTLTLAGLAIASFRGPGSSRPAEAAQGLAPAVATQGATLEHGYIPADTAMIAVIRPAELLANPEISRIIGELEPIKRLQACTNLKPSDVEQFTLLGSFTGLRPEELRRPLDSTPGGAIVRMSKPQDWKAILIKNIPELREARFGDFTYYQIQDMCFSSPDGQILIMAKEPILFRMLTAKPGAADRAPWAEAWKAVKKGQVVVAVDATELLIKFHTMSPGRPADPALGLVAPLLERANGYAISIDASKMIVVDGIATCNNDDNARQVADTLKAVVTLGRNMLASFQGEPGQPSGGLTQLVGVGRPFLEKAAIATEGRTVHLTSSTDLQLSQVVQMLKPSVEDARGAARRSQSVNNMKQIALAFHNYASANGKFPTASILGPDGKTMHSWRVALLPYIGQQALYNEYKLNESWDSPSNRKVAEKMPAIYRHPESKWPNAASYFVFTGKDTLFPGQEGFAFNQILDGASNTIMAVEAVRNIPWTMPADIPFDPKVLLTELGGFTPGKFNVMFADGSVKALKTTINPIILRALISPAGGEIISNDSF